MGLRITSDKRIVPLEVSVDQGSTAMGFGEWNVSLV